MEIEHKIKRTASATALSALLLFGLSACEAEPQNNGSASTSGAPATTSTLPIPEANKPFEQLIMDNTIKPLLEISQRSYDDPRIRSLIAGGSGGSFPSDDRGISQWGSLDGPIYKISDNQFISIGTEMEGYREHGDWLSLRRITARLLMKDESIAPNNYSPTRLKTVMEVEAFKVNVEGTERWEVAGQYPLKIITLILLLIVVFSIIRF